MHALWWLIAWLRGVPGPVTNVRIIDMATIRTISWTLPTVSARQRPIKETEVSYRVKATPALPWTLQDKVAASAAAQRLIINDPAPGTFEYQLVAVDVDGAKGVATVVEKAKAYDPPGAHTGVTVVDSEV